MELPLPRGARALSQVELLARGLDPIDLGRTFVSEEVERVRVSVTDGGRVPLEPV